MRHEQDHIDIDEVQVAADAPEEHSFPRECLDKCLQELSPETRNLLLDYFSEAKAAKIALRESIASSLRTSRTGLRMRVMRAKQSLKTCIERCMDLEAVT
jgi:hypothetical protein